MLYCEHCPVDINKAILMPILLTIIKSQTKTKDLWTSGIACGGEECQNGPSFGL